MIAALAPAGFSPFEVKQWSLSEYRAVQDAYSDANPKSGEPKVPYPPIDDFLSFKRKWQKKKEPLNV